MISDPKPGMLVTQTLLYGDIFMLLRPSRLNGVRRSDWCWWVSVVTGRDHQLSTGFEFMIDLQQYEVV